MVKSLGFNFKGKKSFKIMFLVSWSMEEGHYEIYLDGILNVEGYNLSRSTPILGKGIFIIGQEQDSIGGKLIVIS